MCLETAVAAKQLEGEDPDDSDVDHDISDESGSKRDPTDEDDEEDPLPHEASGLDPINRATSKSRDANDDGEVDEGTMALLKRIKDKKILRHVREETEQHG